MNELKRFLLGKPDLIRPWCVACGSNGHSMLEPLRIEGHHAIPKGMGGLPPELEREIPLLSLCGWGNECGCHHDVHAGLLHFRWVGWWQCLQTEFPTKYQDALAMDGWLDCLYEWVGWDEC